MSSPNERRYRRLLRLLPRDYRSVWEEDMVGTYLDSAGDRKRPSAGERLSVVALAARVRLTGAYARAQHGIWRHTVHRTALLILLWLAALIDGELVVFTWRTLRTGSPDVDWLGQAVLPAVASVAFLGLVLGRGMLARLLIVPGAAILTGMAIGGLRSTTQEAGLLNVVIPLLGACLLVAAMLTLPRDARALRWGWLVALVAGIAVWAWARLQYLDGTIIYELALTAAMMMALALARYRPPHWLFALAIFGALFVGPRITFGPTRVPMFDALVAGLAIACAVVGLITRRRQPNARTATVG